MNTKSLLVPALLALLLSACQTTSPTVAGDGSVAYGDA